MAAPNSAYHIKTAVKQKSYTKKLAQKHTFQEDSLNYYGMHMSISIQ